MYLVEAKIIKVLSRAICNPGHPLAVPNRSQLRREKSSITLTLPDAALRIGNGAPGQRRNTIIALVAGAPRPVINNQTKIGNATGHAKSLVILIRRRPREGAAAGPERISNFSPWSYFISAPFSFRPPSRPVDAVGRPAAFRRDAAEERPKKSISRGSNLAGVNTSTRPLKRRAPGLGSLLIHRFRDHLHTHTHTYTYTGTDARRSGTS